MKTDSTSWDSPEIKPWPETADGPALLDELAETLRRFVILPPGASEALALWILHTYAFGLREVTAYMGIESPEQRCGKTTLVSALGELVNHPVAAAHISSPAFFRVIEETRPTLLIDDAHRLLRPNPAIQAMLYAGYSRKTAAVMRLTPLAAASPTAAAGTAPAAAAPRTRLAWSSCWCPKLLAVTGSLPDSLADRCIVIRLERKTAREKCERLRHLDATNLRRRCARFVLDHGPEITAAQPELPPALNDRAADIWEPLLALADLAGGDWPQRSRRAALTLGEISRDSNPIASLLLDIMKVFLLTEMKQIFSRNLVSSLNCLDEGLWTELRNGAVINEVWLSRQLRPYGIRPRNVRIDDLQAKGYWEEDFSEAFQRYIPPAQTRTLLDEIAHFREQQTPKPATDTIQTGERK